MENIIVRKGINTNSSTVLEDSKQGKQITLERLRFHFHEWENYAHILGQSGFEVHEIDRAVHEILWSKLWVWEFYRDDYGLIYSAEEYIKVASFIKVEKYRIISLLQEAHNNSPYSSNQDIESLINESASKLLYMFPYLTIEIQKRCKNLKEYIQRKIQNLDSSMYQFWGHLLPTSIDRYIWEMTPDGNVIARGKSLQMVLSVISWTKTIAWVLITYEDDFESAYKNEFERHYPWEAKEAIAKAIIKHYHYMPDKFLIFPVIWMKPQYSSLREMLRMMRDAANYLIDDRLAWMPWLAEMDLSNNFFELCANQLDVYPLTLNNNNGEPIIAKNKRSDYKSTPVRFNSFSAVEKTRWWVSSIIEKTTTPNQHLYK